MTSGLPNMQKNTEILYFAKITAPVFRIRADFLIPYIFRYITHKAKRIQPEMA